MTFHVCTSAALAAGGIKMGVKECPLCFKKSESIAGYVGLYFKGCGHTIDGEGWRGEICEMRRELLKLTRKQVAKYFDVKTETVYKWEKRECPLKYLEFTEARLRRDLGLRDK